MYGRGGTVKLPDIEPPVIPKYYSATNQLGLNITLHNGLMQSARREIGCALSLDLHGRKLRLHRDNVEMYCGGQSAREIEMAVDAVIRSQPGCELLIGSFYHRHRMGGPETIFHSRCPDGESIMSIQRDKHVAFIWER